MDAQDTVPNFTMLSFIGLLFLGVLVWPSDSLVIESRPITNYGRWYSMDYCPPNMYAVGVKRKIDRDLLDITALNGVGFYCGELNSPSHTDKYLITSGVGPFGTWDPLSSTTYCSHDRVIVGFYLYSGTITIADDTGALQFTALCGHPFGSRDPSEWKIENGLSDLPMYKYLCPEGYAVNGIRTQVESAQGFGDDTGLNNVDVNCHEIILSCIHEFKTLFDYSNNGSTPVSRSFTEKIAYTHKSGQTEEKSSSDGFKIFAKISKGIQVGADNLTKSINAETGIEYEKVTNQKLMSMVEHTFHHEKEENVDIQIPPESRTIIKQLHIICGYYHFGLPMVVREERRLGNSSFSPITVKEERLNDNPLLRIINNFLRGSPSPSTRAELEFFSYFYLLFLPYIAFNMLSI